MHLDRRTVILGVLSSCCLVAATASAKDADGGEPASDAKPGTAPEPEAAKKLVKRIAGIGSGIGGWFALTRDPTISNTVPYLMAPTVELQFFLAEDYSIDVTLPLTHMIMLSVAAEGFAFDTDAFFNFNVGPKDSIARGVMGPGLGFGFFLHSGYSAAGFMRIPAQIGLELLTPGYEFGFKILARPWAEFGFGDGYAGVGGGGLGMLCFTGFYRE